uniref:Cytochrome c oxidase subunit 6b n=1 Tax=Larix kaempferi TaxID=54800 RepID=C9EIK4_9CONI|nr:cytochrome c oxidase subunit 6b [Larix kaempferi]
MAEVEAQQPTSQEKEEPQQKDEVVAGESEQLLASSEEFTGEVTAIEEETKEVPEVDGTSAEAEATTEAEVTAEEETAGEEETNEEDTVEDPKVKIEDIKTAPADFRFPTTNQTRHCFTRYIEYHKCIAAKGEGASECEKFARHYRSLCPGVARHYRSLCPGEWIDRWNEQRENGTFPGPL